MQGPRLAEGRQLRHRVELLQQRREHAVGVFLAAELIDPREDARERTLDVGDRPLREVLTLMLKASLVPQEFLAIELRPAEEGHVTMC